MRSATRAAARLPRTRRPPARRADHPGCPWVPKRRRPLSRRPRAPVPRSAEPRRQPSARSVFGLPAQRARHDEADGRTLVVDRAGLVVDQLQLLATGDELHLVDIAVAAALPGQEPDVAGVTQ